MKKIELGFEFRASPRVLSGSFAGLMLCAMSGELAPESVSLSTYFPAPSGVYSQMITTGSTYLARDGANAVGIGTTNLVSGAKLRVAGQSVMEGGTLLEARDGTASPGGTARLRIKTESNDLNFYGYDTSEFKFMGVSNSGAKSVSFQVDVGFTNTTPEAPIDVARC